MDYTYIRSLFNMGFYTKRTEPKIPDRTELFRGPDRTEPDRAHGRTDSPLIAMYVKNHL